MSLINFTYTSHLQGAEFTGIIATSVYTQGENRYAACVCVSDRLSIVDITDPTTPILKACISGAGYYLDNPVDIKVATFDGIPYAFVVCVENDYVLKFSLEVPTAPILDEKHTNQTYLYMTKFGGIVSSSGGASPTNEGQEAAAYINNGTFGPSLQANFVGRNQELWPDVYKGIGSSPPSGPDPSDSTIRFQHHSKRYWVYHEDYTIVYNEGGPDEYEIRWVYLRIYGYREFLDAPGSLCIQGTWLYITSSTDCAISILHTSTLTYIDWIRGWSGVYYDTAPSSLDHWLEGATRPTIATVNGIEYLFVISRYDEALSCYSLGLTLKDKIRDGLDFASSLTRFVSLAVLTTAEEDSYAFIGELGSSEMGVNTAIFNVTDPENLTYVSEFLGSDQAPYYSRYPYYMQALCLLGSLYLIGSSWHNGSIVALDIANPTIPVFDSYIRDQNFPVPYYLSKPGKFDIFHHEEYYYAAVPSYTRNSITLIRIAPVAQSIHTDLEVGVILVPTINVDLEAYIVKLLGTNVDIEAWIYHVLETNVDIRAVIIQLLSTEDTDLEMYLWYGSPAHSIQIYVGGVIYDLDADEISIGSIRQFLEKSFGVSKIGNVQVVVANDEHRYSEQSPTSILYGEDYIWQPIRIRTGWGKYLDTNIAMQFEGKILSVDTKDNYTSTFIGYDAIKDLGDFVLTSAITFNTAFVESEAQLESLSPLHIIEYLISWVYERDNSIGVAVHGLKWFNFDITAYEDVIDSVSFNESLSTTVHCSIGETTFAAGTNMLDMIQELLKITGTYMYTGKDGKICFYTATPFRYTTSPTEYSGDVDAGTRHIYISRSWVTVGDVYNELTWKVGAAGTILGPYTNTSSQALYGKKALEFTTSWEIDDNTILPLANRFLTRHQDSVGMVEGNFSYVEAGEALAQDLGDIIRITDPAHNIASKDYEIVQIQRNLSKETMVFRAKDADYLQGKFFKFSSDDDEGDGLGITSANFSTNWKLRFFFFGNAYTTDPHHDGSNPGFDPDGNNNGGIDPGIDPDQWSNGLEEIFIFW